MKHRYIFSGIVNGSDKLSNFRLIRSCRKWNTGDLIRVNIPDDIKINHFHGDCYDTTYCDKTLDELGYDCYILYENRWRKFNWLKCLEPHEWHMALEYIFGLYDIQYESGYTLDEEKYNEWYDECMYGERDFVSESDTLFPKFVEDKIGLDLQINLKEYPFDDEPDKKWWKIYCELYKKQFGQLPKQCSHVKSL